jgi:hypothetical protein
MSYRHRQRLNPRVVFALFTAALMLDAIQRLWVHR